MRQAPFWSGLEALAPTLACNIGPDLLGAVLAEFFAGA
jgi:hypothetical protein